MNNNFKIPLLLVLALILTNCTEKISYSGSIYNFNDQIYTFNDKNDIINNLGKPSYIDPIEKKYFYFSEKIISKNFFDKEVVNRKLVVFHFNNNSTIKSIEEYDLNDQKELKFIKEKTESGFVKKGLIEKIFGGVGATTIPTSP